MEPSVWTDRMLTRLEPSEPTTLVRGARVVQSGTRHLHLWLVSLRNHGLESRMREIRPSGSEGGVALTPPSLPLSGAICGWQVPYAALHYPHVANERYSVGIDC